MAQAEPILKLDTLVARDRIVIDGQPYELVNVVELSILDRHRLERQSERMATLSKSTSDLSDDQVEELRGLLTTMTEMILLAPPEVLGRLKDDHKLAILNAYNASFGDPLRAKQAPLAGPAAPAPPSTGESRSLGSSASTVARRRPGSETRRQRSSPHTSR